MTEEIGEGAGVTGAVGLSSRPGNPKSIPEMKSMRVVLPDSFGPWTTMRPGGRSSTSSLWKWPNPSMNQPETFTRSPP